MGIYLKLVCIMSYMPLNAENCMQNVKKVKNLFSFIKMIRNVTSIKFECIVV